MMSRSRIYLDYNATAPLHANVKDVMNEVMNLIGNPSSVHSFGRRAKSIISDARETVASCIGAESSQILFTSGGTESNALAICSKEYDLFLCPKTEHNAVLKNIESQKEFAYIPVLENGVIDLDGLARLLKENKDKSLFVSIMLANNETGVVQPISDISKVLKKYNCIFHCDAIQALGKINVDVTQLDVDMLSLTAHKIGGPSGVGALYAKDFESLSPFYLGGGHEKNKRSGTENLIGISGFGAAIDYIQKHEDGYKKTTKMRDEFEKEIRNTSSKSIILGESAERLGNTCCLTMPNVPSEVQMVEFDLKGIAISAGSACSSGKVAPSHVLKAMGLEDHVAQTAIRVSLGPYTTMEEMKKFTDCWIALYKKHNETKTAA